MSNTVDPKHPFYLVVPEDRIDGRINFGMLSPGAFGTLDDALEKAREEVEEYGGTVFVMRVTPLGEVVRGRPQVRNISPNAKK